MPEQKPPKATQVTLAVPVRGVITARDTDGVHVVTEENEWQPGATVTDTELARFGINASALVRSGHASRKADK